MLAVSYIVKSFYQIPILKGYRVFDITDNYIMVTIPFNEDVVKAENVGLNDGLNVGLKPVKKRCSNWF